MTRKMRLAIIPMMLLSYPGAFMLAEAWPWWGFGLVLISLALAIGVWSWRD